MTDTLNRDDRPSRPVSSWQSFLRLIGIMFLLVILYGLLMPSIGSGPGVPLPPPRAHIRQIAKAMRNYESTYKFCPPAYTVDATGNKLHCWRTLLLPYLDHEKLYQTIDLSKPWDAPENAAARATSVEIFEPYGIDHSAGQTLYHVVNHPQGLFEGPKQKRASGFKENNTLLVVQAAKTQATHWMQPDEYSLQDLQRISATNASGEDGQTRLTLLDGSDHQLRIQDLTPEQITGLIAIAGSEPPIPVSLFSQPRRTGKND